MGKKYKESLEKVDLKKVYDIKDAFNLILDGPLANFDETVELHLRLGVDSRHADQQVRGSVVLPNGTGKDVKVLVLTNESKQEEAKRAGADFVGDQDLADKILNENFFEFDVVIASPDMMRIMGKLGKVLGPKGLMPSLKAGTVSEDVASAVKEVKAGRIEYKIDKNGIVHCIIGKVSFGVEKLFDNFDVLMSAIVSAKPGSFKGQYIRSCFVTRTMGPGIRVNFARYSS